MPPEEKVTGRAGIGDYVHAMGSIIKKMDVELSETELSADPTYSDLLSRLSITIFIECSKQGLVKPRRLAQPVTIALTSEESVPSVAYLKDEYVVGKALKEGLSTEDVSELERLKADDWERLYDLIEARLIADGWNKKMIGEAYDESKAQFTRRTKQFDNRAFCKAVVTGANIFVESIEAIRDRINSEATPRKTTPAATTTQAPKYREPETTTEDPDDIPF